MPFAQADLETWVKGLGLPEDQQKSVLASLGTESVLSKVGETIMLRPEFSRKMDELQKEKDRLETDYQEKVKKEENFHASLVGWKTDAEKKAEAAIATARQDAEAKLTAVQQKVRELATRNGISEDEIKDLVAASTVEPTRTTRTEPTTRNDDGRFMSKDEFREEAKFYARLPGMQMTIEREYYRLFGNDAPDINWDKLIADASSNKRSLQQQYEASYKVPEKRAEVADTKHKKEIEEAEKRGEEAARSRLLAEHPDMASRTVSREHRGSPILDQAREHAKKAADQHTASGPQETVNAAVKAFREGKYRQDAA